MQDGVWTAKDRKALRRQVRVPCQVVRESDFSLVADVCLDMSPRGMRVYALTPKPGVDLVALAAVLNALPTAVALESLGRGSMGYGVVEHTVRDALELPVLDVRRTTAAQRARLAGTLSAIARRPIEHVRVERDRADREALDAAALSLAARTAAYAEALWDALLVSVALRDRYLLPSV